MFAFIRIVMVMGCLFTAIEIQSKNLPKEDQRRFLIWAQTLLPHYEDLTESRTPVDREVG